MRESTWEDFTQPYIGSAQNPPPEEALFLERLHRPEHRSFLQNIEMHVAQRRKQQTDHDLLTSRASTRSASIFVPDTRDRLWCRLAIGSGMLPALGVMDDDLQMGADWLSPPWFERGAVRVVKATRCT